MSVYETSVFYDQHFHRTFHEMSFASLHFCTTIIPYFQFRFGLRAPACGFTVTGESNSVLTKTRFLSCSGSLLVSRAQILSNFRRSHIFCAPQRAQPVSLSSSDLLQSSQIGFTSQNAPSENFFKLLGRNNAPKKSHSSSVAFE